MFEYLFKKREARRDAVSKAREAFVRLEKGEEEARTWGARKASSSGRAS